MNKVPGVFHNALPWAGLIIGLPALIFVHQFGSQGTFDDCELAPGPALIVAFVGLTACLASGLASWRGTRGSDQSTRRLIGTICFACSILFAYAILLAILALIILPPCFG